MQAQVATAHKIARTVYHLLKYKTAYHDIGAKAYEQQAPRSRVSPLAQESG